MNVKLSLTFRETGEQIFGHPVPEMFSFYHGFLLVCAWATFILAHKPYWYTDPLQYASVAIIFIIWLYLSHMTLMVYPGASWLSTISSTDHEPHGCLPSPTQTTSLVAVYCHVQNRINTKPYQLLNLEMQPHKHWCYTVPHEHGGWGWGW